MLKSIVTDVEELSKKCIPCTFDGSEERIIKDLLDTARINKRDCVGLAANQIGYNSRIIVIAFKDDFIPLINPVIMPLRTEGIKRREEGCLSFPGRKQISIRRYKKIKVKYCLVNGDEKMLVLTGFHSAICQHECDHLNGLLIWGK